MAGGGASTPKTSAWPSSVVTSMPRSTSRPASAASRPSSSAGQRRSCSVRQTASRPAATAPATSVSGKRELHAEKRLVWQWRSTRTCPSVAAEQRGVVGDEPFERLQGGRLHLGEMLAGDAALLGA